MPVIFGPNHAKFREAVEIIKSGAGFPVNNEEELSQILDELLNNSQTLTKTSAIAREFVNSNCGATEQVVEAIELKTKIIYKTDSLYICSLFKNL